VEFDLEVTIHRPVAAVFAYVTDVRNVPEWQESAESAEWIEQGRRFRERRHFMGRAAELELEVTTLEPERRFDIRTLNSPVAFEIRHSFAAVDGGTRPHRPVQRSTDRLGVGELRGDDERRTIERPHLLAQHGFDERAGVEVDADADVSRERRNEVLLQIQSGRLVHAVAQATPDRPCPDLSGGTAGLPEKDFALALEDGLAAPLPPVPAGPVPADLPRHVDFRTTTTTFNRRYAFVLRAGHVYYRAQPAGAWARLPVPSCFDGDVRGISVDDDELVAIDRARHVFTMDGALRPPALFNWTERWGPPFWTGAGRRLPDGPLWSWSVLSPAEDRTWTDSAGNRQPVGDEKVSHVWLVRDNGRRLVYMDPWLPADDSYEMCGPQRGRFRAVAMSAAASTVFVMNSAGAMYTRLYDFDMSGADSFFDHYSYEDQRGKHSSYTA